MKTTIEVSNICKNFNKYIVLNNMTFKALEGEVFGLVAPNGSGKSTILKIITGLLKQDSGSVNILGNSLSENYPKVLKNIGALIEQPAFYEYLSGYENLKVFSELKKDIKHIQNIANTVGLNDGDMKKKVAKYSLGMKQRLGIGQAILNDPKLIILDEPLNGLDVQGISDMRRIIKYLAKEQGKTILITSHILSELEKVCDKVLIFKKGEVLLEAYLSEILNDINTYFITLKAPIINLANFTKKIEEVKIINYYDNVIVVEAKNIDALNRFIKILIENNITILEFYKDKNSLETLYFNLINRGSD